MDGVCRNAYGAFAEVFGRVGFQWGAVVDCAAWCGAASPLPRERVGLQVHDEGSRLEKMPREGVKNPGDRPWEPRTC